MKKIKDLNRLIAFLMIVLLSYSISWCQESNKDKTSLYGEVTINQDSAIIAISAIRIANRLMIEGQYNIVLLNSFKQIVKEQELQKELLNEELKLRNKNIIELIENNNNLRINKDKIKEQRNLSLFANGILGVIIILFAL